MVNYKSVFLYFGKIFVYHYIFVHHNIEKIKRQRTQDNAQRRKHFSDRITGPQRTSQVNPTQSQSTG